MSPPPLAAVADQRFGIFHGVVVDVVDPKQLNQVKVKVEQYAAGYEEWARVAQSYAGDGFGSTWIPEVDSEVLVAFAQGDMRIPYVLACLHSEKEPPPVARTASEDVKKVITPKGSELSFDEANGTIDLKTKSGATIRLDETAGSITLESQQKIELKAPQITIEASAKVTVSGAQVAIN
jgi:phage baseplate assembly protein V